MYIKVACEEKLKQYVFSSKLQMAVFYGEHMANI